MTANIEINQVHDDRAIQDFLDVPRSIYHDDPNWIAPLDLERREHLSRKHNPYFEHAEAQLFTASIAGRLVGRISAQIDQLRLDKYQDACGQFGFLEAIDEPALFAKLLTSAEGWLRQRGMTHVKGTFSFSINEETGLLVDGFERPPSVMMGHAKPYYGPQLERLGYAKARDVIAYDYDGLSPLPRSMRAMVDKATASGEMSVRAISKKQLARDLDIIIDIFNDAWSDNWEFVPMTTAEINALGKNLKMLVSEGYIAIASWQGEPAAMAITLPDINDWIRDLDGKLLPAGWAKLLWRMFARPPKAVRMPLMGVRKTYQSSPVGAALALGVIDAVRDYHVGRGTTRAELSWILEDNTAMCRMIEALGASPYKTYRVYERAI
ncbi:MAG: dATP pyrophosphohydrolase [Aestuariivirgaceae bacterium]